MAKKKPAKKAPAKQSAKKVMKSSAPARKIPAVKKPMTKTEIINEVAQNAELTKKEVSSVFDELAVVIERHIKKRAPGKFVFPGLMEIEIKKKPATKARKGINPFTGILYKSYGDLKKQDARLNNHTKWDNPTT